MLSNGNRRALIGVAGKGLSIAAVALLATGMWVVPIIEASGNSASSMAPDSAPPVTSDAPMLQQRLAAKGVVLGTPIMIRIFKEEAELEVWIDKGPRYERFAVYEICNWSGVLGPKLTEGDRQSPEGLYSIGIDQLHRKGRWRRSLDLGYPNTFDKALLRTGSYILMHGGCTSIGCFAMTNPVMEEIFTLTEAALFNGQQSVQVHVFPFRMTRANLHARASSPWLGFWSNLKEAYDAFERTSVPPHVNVCGNRYLIGQAPDPNYCVSNVSEASVSPPPRSLHARLARHGRVASRRARYVRRAYAARRARVAAQARRSVTYLGGPARVAP